MYAIYLRKSRKDKELEKLSDAETLARHEKTLLNLAQKNNYAIGEIYREVVSGETIEARPEMKKLLRAVEAGTYEGVLVMEVERLARGNTKDQGIVSETFGYSNTLIVTPNKIYDPSNEFDEEYFEFGLFMSRREYKTINRRIQRGRIASLNEGKYIAGTPPYGYDKIKIQGAKGYTLTPNKNADAVRLIYQLYTNNRLGMHTIAKRLDAMGFKPIKNENWSTRTIKGILTNPTYIGKVRWQWRKVEKKMENGKIIEHRPKRKLGEYMLIDGLHPAIIDPETFAEAQKILAGRYIAPITSCAELKNPLSGIVYCEKCGALMTRAALRNGPFLKCSNINCDNVMSKLDLVEEAIIKSLKEWFSDYKLNFVGKYHKQDLSSQKSAVKSYQNKLKTLNKQLSSTYTFLEQGVYTTEVFKQRNSAIQSDILAAEAALKAAQKKLEDLSDANSILTAYIPKTEALLSSYIASDTKKRNDILKELLEKVTYIKTEKGKKYHPAPFSIRIYPKMPKLK